MRSLKPYVYALYESPGARFSNHGAVDFEYFTFLVLGLLPHQLVHVLVYDSHE